MGQNLKKLKEIGNQVVAEGLVDSLEINSTESFGSLYGRKKISSVGMGTDYSTYIQKMLERGWIVVSVDTDYSHEVQYSTMSMDGTSVVTSVLPPALEVVLRYDPEEALRKAEADGEVDGVFVSERKFDIEKYEWGKTNKEAVLANTTIFSTGYSSSGITISDIPTDYSVHNDFGGCVGTCGML